ncbi:MAG: GspH/FimT family pseudopilin [Burkholderiales bacterium]
MSISEPLPRTGGFTLIEVLVVVTIIALLVSLVAVKLAPDARQSLGDEGAQLAALLTHARHEAIATGAPLAWQRTEAGYQFLQRGPDRKWQPIADDASLRARTLPTGVSFASIETPATASRGSQTVILLPTGIADPFRITLMLGEYRVRVTSDGATAPSLEYSGN